MDESNLLDTIAWLDGAKHPLLVQLPRAEYERLKTAWGLPTNKEPRGPLATREAP
jgi:D-alanyl-D-alanine dipeptidase